MTSRRQLARTLHVVLAGVALGVTPLPAQIVQGSVVDSATSAPLRGAVVFSSRDATGAAGPRVLADVDGRFAWRAPAAGAWTLEIRAIGFVPTKRSLTLGEGETVRLSVQLKRAALSLASVRVQERSSCRARTELAEDASTLWNDIWSALASTVASRDVTRQALRITHYVRTRRAPAGVVEFEERTLSRAATSKPFRAVAAAELARTGFRVTHDDGSTTFHAPDAETLIAPEFIARHCYGITRADTGSRKLLGVAFWPHRANESSDVEGVLWVDAQTRELQLVEFHYPALRELESADGVRFGGFASYARQPDGSWIIDGWQIRVPVVVRTRRVIGVGNRRFGEDVQDSVVQISEEGGYAAVEGSARQFGLIGGVVRDEAGQPQSGTNVEVLGTTLTSMTDSLGVFKLTDVLPGRYLLRAYRGSLDSRPSFLAESEMEVTLGDSASWSPVARERTSVRAACPRRSDRSRDAAVGVVLRDGVSQRPLRSHPLLFLITTLTGVSVTQLQRHEVTVEQTSDWRGQIPLCNVPPLAELRVREPSVATWSLPVRIRAAFTILDVDVEAESGVVSVLQANDPVAGLDAPELRAPSRASLIGRLVSDDSTSQPMMGVEVTADVPIPTIRENSAGVDIRPGVSSRSVRTNSAGVFVINDLPLGVVVVRARFLGFVPVQRALLLTDSPLDTVTIRLSRTATLLAPVTVTAEAEITRIGMREFASRRSMGFGVFLDVNDIERSKAYSLGSVIASTAAGLDLVKVLSKGFAGSGYAVASRRYHNLSGQKCYSQVVLNGVRVYPQAAASESTPFVVDQIDKSDVLGIEIYRSAADTPLQFGGPTAACGTVVIWTK